MLDTLRLVFAVPAVTCWVGIVCAATGFLLVASAYELNERARHVIADARLALDRSGHSIDRASRCIRMSQPKLSDQFRGAAPFTALARLLSNDELSEFEPEFLAIRAKRYGLRVVPADLGDVLAKVIELVNLAPKPMAKAVLATTKEKVTA